jgi:hypothetical protein
VISLNQLDGEPKEEGLAVVETTRGPGTSDAAKG